MAAPFLFDFVDSDAGYLSFMSGGALMFTGAMGLDTVQECRDWVAIARRKMVLQVSATDK